MLKHADLHFVNGDLSKAVFPINVLRNLASNTAAKQNKPPVRLVGNLKDLTTDFVESAHLRVRCTRMGVDRTCGRANEIELTATR